MLDPRSTRLFPFEYMDTFPSLEYPTLQSLLYKYRLISPVPSLVMLFPYPYISKSHELTSGVGASIEVDMIEFVLSETD